MAYETIELERDGDVAIIRLNDPATLNAVTLKTIVEIGAALDAFKAKNHVYRFHRDEDQEPTVDYVHVFSISIGTNTHPLTLSLSEELISEDAFMLPDRKSWVDEISEELG